MRGREWAFGLLAAALGLVLALVAVEVTLRAAVGKPAAIRSTAVAERHRAPWGSADFRRLPALRPGPAFRILALGDSFTWGWGVYPEDAWPQRLERLLRRSDLPVGCQVVTVSRPGWGTSMELRAARQNWGWARPDLVLVGYALNDAEPPPGRALQRLKAPLHRRKPRSAASRQFYSASHLYRLVWDRLENTRQHRAFRRVYDSFYGVDGGWQRTLRALDGFRELSQQRGVPVVVAIFPNFEGPLDHRYRYRDLHQRVAAEVRSRELRALDLLSAYRGVDGRRLALEPFNDAHPNELAHRLAAERIRDYLVEEGLLPTAAPRVGNLERE